MPSVKHRRRRAPINRFAGDELERLPPLAKAFHAALATPDGRVKLTKALGAIRNRLADSHSLGVPWDEIAATLSLVRKVSGDTVRGVFHASKSKVAALGPAPWREPSDNRPQALERAATKVSGTSSGLSEALATARTLRDIRNIK